MAEETKTDDRRFFLGTDSEKYFIIPPSANDIREADWHYSKTYTRSLTEGITTSHEMMDILRRRGIIGAEFDKRAAELAKNLNEAVWALEAASDMVDKRDLAVKVAEARDELFQWNQRLNGPMSNTCENMADDARLEYLTSCIVVKEDGTRVWTKYDDYLKEKNINWNLMVDDEIRNIRDMAENFDLNGKEFLIPKTGYNNMPVELDLLIKEKGGTYNYFKRI